MNLGDGDHKPLKPCLSVCGLPVLLLGYLCLFPWHRRGGGEGEEVGVGVGEITWGCGGGVLVIHKLPLFSC